jgi:hypothetical protein
MSSHLPSYAHRQGSELYQAVQEQTLYRGVRRACRPEEEVGQFRIAAGCVQELIRRLLLIVRRKLWRKNDTKFDYPYKEC